MLHTSDLHIGKRIHGYSMIEDQRFVLDSIVNVVRERHPDALVIAGDVYDRAIPSEEAVTLFGDFLSEVADLGCQIYVVAGNHDSGARLEFCGPILGRSGIHIAGEFTGRAERHTVADEHGELDIWLLPYFRVSEVRASLGADVQGYADAMAAVIGESGVDPSRRNLLVAHQFFSDGDSGPMTSESEDQRPEVGGISCIPASSLDAFDYVALGHLHIPQSVSRETVRYSGSPLKYSASEALWPKSVSLVDIGPKGRVSVEAVPLSPMRDLRVLKGRLDDIIAAGYGDPEGRDDYIIVQLSEPPGHLLPELYKVYPGTMSVSVAASDRIVSSGTLRMEAVRDQPPAELFAEFYREVTGEDLTPYQRDVLRDIIAEREGSE